MKWYEYPVSVPFGNPNYDVGLGGSHDMDIAAPPNYPVTALLSGTVVTVTEPSWGKQIGIELDNPYNDIPYMAYLHLSATNVRLGQHVNAGDIIGWVGGATSAAQYNGTTNPTGQNFLNDPIMSSQVQVGIALMRGPVYGSGAGWETFPPVDMELDPTQIILEAREANTMGVDYFEATAHFVPDSYTFTSNSAKAIVIHKTGGDNSNQAVYNTFMATTRSTHYAIDLDGSIWQFVPEARGAGGNCCLEAGYNSFWSQYATLNADGTTTPNLNMCTFSIEHVDPTSDNSNPMPAAQVNASHRLVAYLCKKYHIDTEHIHSHASLDPQSKARCPGTTYDFNALFTYVNAVLKTDTRTAFNQEWASGGLYNPLTAIANAAYATYLTPSFHGCPVSQEYLLNGNIAQRVNSGIWIWDGHTATFYPYR